MSSMMRFLIKFDVDVVSFVMVADLSDQEHDLRVNLPTLAGAFYCVLEMKPVEKLS